MVPETLVKNTRLSYDAESDVLYINFGKPQQADDSDITDEGIVVRLRDDKIIGLTILNASCRVLTRA